MAATRSPASSFAHEEGSAVALALAMAEGRASSERIVRDCLERIDAIDRNGPRLNSVIEINPDALAIADALDAERRRRPGARAAARHPGPGQGQHRHRRSDGDHRRVAGAGGPARPRDAFVVERLREAGAVILGKTNLSEWANFRSTHSAERLERARRADAAIRTRSIAMPAARAPARPPRSRRTWRPSPSAPRPTARSSGRRRPAASSASSRPSAW